VIIHKQNDLVDSELYFKLSNTHIVYILNKNRQFNNSKAENVAGCQTIRVIEEPVHLHFLHLEQFQTLICLSKLT
jgi:hypothetical protein